MTEADRWKRLRWMQNDAGSTDTTETEREQGRWTETGREWRKWVTRDRNAEDHTG